MVSELRKFFHSIDVDKVLILVLVEDGLGAIDFIPSIEIEES